MKKISIICFILFLSCYAEAQYKLQLSPKASLGTNTNIETYFFAEKLAVEKINYVVFDHKDQSYSHQPIVYYGFIHFKQYQNDPAILRIAEIIKQIRDTFYDNSPILDYLLNQKEFPAKGARFKAAKTGSNEQAVVNSKTGPLLAELTDSLRSFYIHADVGGFLKLNERFLKGAMNETAKDINKPAFDFMEKWYGKKFPQYDLYISPAMPINSGEDNYRGVGIQILSSKGKIPSMIISSSKMLPLQGSLSDYKLFGFDNPQVTGFLTTHEIQHTFVNPLLDTYITQLKGDSLLYTKEIKAVLAPHGINDWYVCVIEHLVRLGEIRIAVSMHNTKEADRLRKLHIGEYNCVLIPLLEDKIQEYENNRTKYPTFESYLPVLMDYFHSLSPEIIDDQLIKYKNYR